MIISEKHVLANCLDALQEDGYQYLNPKQVFERKYSEVKE